MKELNPHTRIWRMSDMLLLLVLALTCYWPLSTGLFAAKNDNITQFLPTRFHVSEALRHFRLPVWTPYMYLGYPVGGDMQGGAWNPIVWLLSAFGRYSATSLHAEILIYIFFAGAGMYRLLRSLELPYPIATACGAAYMMCGYVSDVSGSNAPFLAAAAGIPFAFVYWLELTRKPDFLMAWKAGVSLAFLFVTAYPSFFICASYVISTGLILQIAKYRKQDKAALARIMAYSLLAALLFVVMASPAIISYAQILPFYARGEGISLALAQDNAFHPSATWSYILPAYTVKSAELGRTDLISRNGYANILILVFAFFSFRSISRRSLIFLLSGLGYFYFFSLGDQTPVRAISYHLLPLMDTFRHPSNGRLFVILALIILGAKGWSALPTQYGLLRSISMVLIGVLFVFCLFHLSELSFDAFSAFRNSADLRLSLKGFLDGLRPAELGTLNAVMQIISLACLIAFRRRPFALTCLVIANSFLIAQLTIPYTTATKAPPKPINEHLNHVAYGYPEPDATLTIGKASSDSLVKMETIGIQTFYSKNIAQTRLYFTPTYPALLDSLYAHEDAVQRVVNHPYAFAEPSASWQLQKITNSSFKFRIQALEPTRFHLRQLHLPFWACSIDGKPVPIVRSDVAFLSADVTAGVHVIEFNYRQPFLLPALTLTLGCLVAGIFILVKRTRYGNRKED